MVKVLALIGPAEMVFSPSGGSGGTSFWVKIKFFVKLCNSG